MLTDVIQSIHELANSVLLAVSGRETTKETYEEGQKIRSSLVAKIQRDFSAIELKIAQASFEVSYSFFSIGDFNHVLLASKSVASILFSLHTKFDNKMSHRLFSSPEFGEQIAPAMKETWSNLKGAIDAALDAIKDKLAGGLTAKNNDDSEIMLKDMYQETRNRLEEVVNDFEQHQPNTFLEVFAEKHELELGLPQKLKEGWDKLIEITFFVLASKELYKYWLATVGVLAFNLVACLSILASHSTTTGGSDFGGALIYTATISALSFFAWYRPVYTAFAKDSSLFFYIFLLFEGLHICFAAYMAVGLPGSGSAGVINLLSVLTDGKYVSAAFCIVATAGWIADALFGFWLWVEVNTHVKRGGHSLDSARAQAVSMGVLGSSG
ncbi:hypothetical protein HK100_006001 [Physocladia obscura]|uniref:Uncharacterized protein n=1 Tax=Physocladia obscura TaxID=109957 RepID=A0AAD5SR24_9FUNG|nr:hypothetical protein HK100_006001 [Physocladia obscura]